MALAVDLDALVHPALLPPCAVGAGRVDANDDLVGVDPPAPYPLRELGGGVAYDADEADRRRHDADESRPERADRWGGPGLVAVDGMQTDETRILSPSLFYGGLREGSRQRAASRSADTSTWS